jgi:hypothetical protein
VQLSLSLRRARDDDSDATEAGRRRAPIPTARLISMHADELNAGLPCSHARAFATYRVRDCIDGSGVLAVTSDCTTPLVRHFISPSNEEKRQEIQALFFTVSMFHGPNGNGPGRP